MTVSACGLDRARALELEGQELVSDVASVHGALDAWLEPAAGCSFEADAESAAAIIHGDCPASLATAMPYMKVMFATPTANGIRRDGTVGPEIRGEICTTVQVNETTLLTAAHCVLQPDGRVYPLNQLIHTTGTGRMAYPTAVHVPSGVVKTATWVNPPNQDLAIIKIQPLPLAAGYPTIDLYGASVGQNATMVGYGETAVNRQNYGTLCKGVSEVTGISPGFIHFTHTPDLTPYRRGDAHSLASRGDSGGPLFRAGSLIGIMGGAGHNPNAAAGTYSSHYVNLGYGPNAAFLRQHGLIR